MKKAHHQLLSSLIVALCIVPGCSSLRDKIVGHPHDLHSHEHTHPDVASQPEVDALRGRIDDFDSKLTSLTSHLTDAQHHTHPNPCEEALVLRGVFFGFDQSDIQPGFGAKLSAVAARLNGCPAVRIKVEGHTDSVGSSVYNEALSTRRAHAVVRYLEAQGVAAERLEAAGRGEGSPAEPNENEDGSDNPAGRAMNRRVMLIPQ